MKTVDDIRPYLTCMGLAFATLSIGGCNESPTPSSEAQNNAPVVERLSVTPVQLEPGGEATLTARVMDPDTDSSDSDDDSNGDDAPQAPDGVEFAWSTDNDDWTIEGNGTTATLAAPDGYDQSTTVHLDVTDGSLSAHESMRVDTVHNDAPRIRQMNAADNPLAPGDTTTLSAEAVDDNDDELSFAWTAPDGWGLASTDGSQVDVTAPDDAGAIGRITLEVTDGYDGKVNGTLQLRTQTDAPPKIASMAASPPQVDPGGTTTVSVDASDPEGTELSYDWSAPMNWTVEGEGSEISVTAPDAYDSNGKVAVTVTDENGHETTGRITVSTATNRGPNISAMTATPRQLERGESADLAVTAADPDGDDLTYQWSISDQDWTLSDGDSGPSAKLQAPSFPAASTHVTVTVTDTDGKSATAEIIVSTAPNRAPSLGSVSANPAVVDPGTSSQLNVRASDPDGDDLTYSWNAPSDWTVSSSGAGATLQAPDTFGTTGVVDVTVKDGFGGQTSGSVAVTTANNQPPTISNVTAQPVVVEKQGTTTLSVAASDPDGDSLNYSWSVPSEWTQNGSGAQIDVQAPDTYDVQGQFSVTVTDADGATTTGSVTAQTVENQPPVVVSMTADTTELNPGGTTTVRVEAVELDGESLNYSWTVPSDWQGSSNGPSIEITAPGSPSEQATIQVDIDDGHDTVTKSLTLKTTGS